jgi:predicted DNA-binding WGR domain protein
MKLVRQTRLHFKEGNSDKVYEVDLCEIGGRYVVNFRYGRRGAALKEGTKTTNPVTQDEAEKIFEKLVSEKTNKGYHLTGEDKKAAPKSAVKTDFNENARNEYILQRLREGLGEKGLAEKIIEIIKKVADAGKKVWKIERVIWRAGELKIKEAAPLIVKYIGTKDALRDYCCAWSLGFCGDETTIPILSGLYNKPNTPDFVRRIAGEAMLKLADESAKKQHQEQFIKQLPPELQTVAGHSNAALFTEKLNGFLQKPIRGSHTVLEKIYQINNEIVRPALLEILRTCPLKPKYFKPLRHIFKAAEYRRDAEVFGLIARRFETENQMFSLSGWVGKNWRRWEYVDGASHETKRADLEKEEANLAYSNRTRDYLRRRCWRVLRRLGEIGDADYVKMAVGALLAYTDADAQEVKTSTFYSYRDENGNWNWSNPRKWTVSWDRFAPYLLFNHILYENSPRYELTSGSRAFRVRKSYKLGNPAPDFREEAFPKLWEKQPVGLLHLLSESDCQPVHEFAVKALRDCRKFIDLLDVAAVLMLLNRPYDITAGLGFELAKKRYDANNPNIDLVVAVAICRNAEARAEARSWIDAKRELFAKNGQALFRLLTCDFADTRTFAENLLQTTYYTDTEAQNLIARLVSEMLVFDKNRREQAQDLGEAIFKSFSKQLRTINLDVVLDLLRHPLVEVQTLGGNILLNHETPPENLPSDLINSLIASPFAEIRAIGIRLFGQLPEENLLKRDQVILRMLAHEFPDVSFSTRPIVQKLGAKSAAFVEKMTRSIVVALLQNEESEGVHARLLNILKEDLPDWQSFVDEELARILVKSEFSIANEAGGLAMQSNAEKWATLFTTADIINFTNHEVKAVREASWKLADFDKNRFQAKINSNFAEEVSLLVRALDAKWDDSRDFWFEFFRQNLTANELSPEILVSICDSVKKTVQAFGREQLLIYFQEDNGVEYLLKLSEHPSPEMQLFATNYLENHAADAPEKLARLAPYFVRVLSLVNRARTAKTRILQFLEREALKNEKSAQIVAEILGRQSATVAIGDKATAIETMLKIRRQFPEISLPIQVKSVEVRGNAV